MAWHSAFELVSSRGHHLSGSCQAASDPLAVILILVTSPASRAVAAASALVLGEGRGLVYHAHEEERRARDDVHALSAHVLKERVVDGRELLGRHRPFQFLEVAKDGPERLRPDLVQGDLGHLRGGILDLVLELVLPLFRCCHLALEVGEPLLSILEFATLVGEFCQDVVQLLLEGLLLLPERVAPVRAKAVIGERSAGSGS